MNSQISIRRMNQLYNATVLKKWRGVQAAAKYMYRLGWSIEAALFHLLRKDAR